MSQPAWARYSVAACAGVVLAHILITVLVITGLRALYPHRIYDVRQWSDDAAKSFRLVGTYLVENTSSNDRPVTVFAGSSVTYGYQFANDVTFARHYAEQHPDRAVFNVSIIAADVSGVNDWIVCAARRNAIHLDTLVIELPVVNTMTYLVKGHQAGEGARRLMACDEADPDPGYARFALTTFRGTGWLGFFWNYQPLRGDDGPVQIERVPKGYFAAAPDFAAVRAEFANQINTTLEHAKSVAATVYAFPSPVYLAGLRSVEEDPDAIGAQLSAALEACRAVAGVRCIDPSPLYDQPGYFYNFTHLNRAGHRAMGELIDAAAAEH